MHALGVVARARGMTDVARAAGLTREALYKALRPNSQPRFDTIARVCRALGLKLTTQVQVHAGRAARLWWGNPIHSLRRTKCERPDPARGQATIQLMKRHILTAALLIAVTCSNPAFAQPKPLQGQKYPDVIAVKVHPANAGLFDFDVTVSSPYDSAKRYADAFRIQSKDGVVLGERRLLHDHASEQPFTIRTYSLVTFNH